jgi:glycosyltransferase involved in cell wall biosynthesis
MNILISTYACAPNRGSEHGIGWNWTTEAVRLGHKVWALASPAHRDSILMACRNLKHLKEIHWVFPEVIGWPLHQAVEPKWERTYNLLWQVAALHHAQRLHKEFHFDLIHHLTWGGVRAPTFLGLVGTPLIIGPTGGGETSPTSLREGFSIKGRAIERIRDFSNATITINPFVRSGLIASKAIFVKTAETRNLLSAQMQEKTQEFIELTLGEHQIATPRFPRNGPLKLLYAGRLLYWKGVHIAIEAFSKVLRVIPDASFTIVGKGPEERRLRSEAKTLNIDDKIAFIPWVPQERLFSLYDEHDLFIFPSLHDSSGGVVLEAFARGLPVVCLDLGGPKVLARPSCAAIIPTSNRSTAEVAFDMANAICEISSSPDTLTALSAGAVERAKEFILNRRVTEFYRRVSGLGRISPPTQ